MYFNIVAETNENTVVTEYTPVPKRSEAYQSEAELEREFIKILGGQGYEYAPAVNDEVKIIHNLRMQLEKLNGVFLKTKSRTRILPLPTKRASFRRILFRC